MAAITASRAKAITTALERALSEQATPGRAEYEKKYLKSDLRFLGASAPVVRAECARLYKSLRAIDKRHLDVLTAALWKSNCHELRSVAICLMVRFSKMYSVKELPTIKTLILQSAGWAHVDWIATDLVASIYSREPASAKELRKWSTDNDFWVRRAAMLALLREARLGNRDAFDLFSEFAAGMISEKEFFVRKAIGWVLREVSKKNPEWTFEFLLKYKETASGLTMREGSKYLPAAMQSQLKR